MNEHDQRYLATAAVIIDQVLAAQGAKPLRPAGLSPELQTFAERFDQLLDAFETSRRFMILLANGNIAHDPPPGIHLLGPLKHLQANLRHLTWQTQQVAAGDLDQQVDFLGEFSTAFNKLIAALREKRAAEEKARYLSVHDSLTGLYNRNYFNETLDRLCEQNYPVSLLIADLDGLKTANDTRGHLIGDLLIKKAAQVLQHGVRPDDVVTRIGGDEFAIILHNTDADRAAVAISQIRATMDAYNQRDRAFAISMSLGASTAHYERDLMETLRLADEAMYRDKTQRKAMARQSQSGISPHR